MILPSQSKIGGSATLGQIGTFLGVNKPAPLDTFGRALAGADGRPAVSLRMNKPAPAADPLIERDPEAEARRGALGRHLRELRSAAGFVSPHHHARVADDGSPVPSPVRVCGIASNGAITTLGYRDAMRSPGVAGVQHCGNIWECACCAAIVSCERAREITHVVGFERAKKRTIYLVTLTVRHYAAHDLEVLRRGVADAWSGVLRQRGFRAWRSRQNAAYVRRLEVTHGGNGWHPHLHLLIIVDNEESEEAIRARLFKAWTASVETHLGPEYVGDPNHAVRVDRVRATDSAALYLSKLGLEMTDAFAKKTARDGQRTPWAILGSVATLRRFATEDRSIPSWAKTGHEAEDPDPSLDRLERDSDLWRTWVAKTRGAKQLTWSRGLRQRCGLAIEETDEVIAERAAYDYRPVAIVPNEARVAILGRPHVLEPMLDAIRRGEGFEALEHIARSNLRPEIVEAFVKANEHFDPAIVIAQYQTIRDAIESHHRERKAERLQPFDWSTRIAEGWRFGHLRKLAAKARARRTWSPHVRTYAPIEDDE